MPVADGEALRRLQHAFAAHIRDPEGAPAPEGIEDRRLAIYRDLFFNNLRDLLGRSFPVTRKILGEAAWQRMVRDWLIRHRAQTPLFLELPQEFLGYLAEERTPAPDDPPFLTELAHYEWVELALAIDERDIVSLDVDGDGDLLAGIPVLSPLAWSLAYEWPVHRLSPDYQPAEPPAEPTRLLVWRDRVDKVGFMEINLVTARLVELLAASEEAAPRTGRDCMLQIAAELGQAEAEPIVAAGAEVLQDLRARDIIVGTAIER
ncbi:DUF2063 domain-containing protein [Wenzhouxiangella sp. XN24]|nr:DUF2063 domain-containing protein [Wenzhouxiangella sp. XN24]